MLINLEILDFCIVILYKWLENFIVFFWCVIIMNCVFVDNLFKYWVYCIIFVLFNVVFILFSIIKGVDWILRMVNNNVIVFKVCLLLFNNERCCNFFFGGCMMILMLVDK